MSKLDLSFNDTSKAIAQARHVPDVATLRTIEPQFDGQQIQLLGHTVKGVGGGTFYYDADNTDADDNGVTVVTGEGNRWVRRLDGFVTPEMFGSSGTAAEGENDLSAFSAMLAINKSVVCAGQYYIDGDGSQAPLLTWYNTTSSKLTMQGVGTYSEVRCSPSVVNLLAATGVTITNMSFDGGFDPNESTMVLKPLLTLNQNTIFYRNRVRNTYGSNVFSKFGPCMVVDNDLGDYGDHAFYTSSNDDDTYSTKDIYFVGNRITQDSSYSNDASFGSRDAVKIRNPVAGVIVALNRMTGVSNGISIESDSTRAPKLIKIIDNVIHCSKPVYTSNYSGITVKTGGTSQFELDIRGNTIVGDLSSGGNGRAFFIECSVVNSVFSYNEISNFDVAVQSTVEEGLSCSQASNNYIHDCSNGFFNLGSFCGIRFNRISNISGTGIRDKYGNKSEFNTIDSCGYGIQKFTNESSVGARSTINQNVINGCGSGIGIYNIDPSDDFDLLNNELSNNVDNSIILFNSDSAVNASNYRGNIVNSGPNLPSGFVDSGRISVTSSLPSASSEMRGKYVIVESDGVDSVYVCKMTSVGVFEWVLIS